MNNEIKDHNSKYCCVCGKTTGITLKRIEYRGKEFLSQSLFLCENCGLIWSDKKTVFESNDMAGKKDNFLRDKIALYVEYIKEKYEIDSVNLTLSNIAGFPVSFNRTSGGNELLVISEYLEHVMDLEIAEQAIADISAPFILVECPIYDIYNANDTDMYGFFIKSHNYYYSVKTIDDIFRKLGYSLVDYRIEFGEVLNMPMIFPCILGVWKKSGQTDTVLSFVANIYNYLDECEKKAAIISDRIDSLVEDDVPIAVWGTGNYAEKLLAMTSLRNKNIVRFYDGNSKAWGKTFADQTVSKFAINEIKQGMVKKIFIASNTAQKAIRSDLINKYFVEEEDIIML